jgi:hypothetical protein
MKKQCKKKCKSLRRTILYFDSQKSSKLFLKIFKKGKNKINGHGKNVGRRSTLKNKNV